MKKATAVEKRFFPWTYDRFLEALLHSAERLHWSECEVAGSCVTARALNHIKLGDTLCPLEFTMNASWRQIGNDGIELVLSVSEDKNSWSMIECKKKCKVLLDFLCAPLFPIRHHSDIAMLKG